jgi:hypothetical protein
VGFQSQKHRSFLTVHLLERSYRFDSNRVRWIHKRIDDVAQDLRSRQIRALNESQHCVGSKMDRRIFLSTVDRLHLNMRAARRNGAESS